VTVSAGSSSGPGSPAGNADPPPQTSATIRSSGPGPATASNSAANAAGPAVSGTRMGRFRNADTGGWAGMAIARDRHTLKRAFPKPPERCGKLRRTISCADHQGEAPWAVPRGAWPRPVRGLRRRRRHRTARFGQCGQQASQRDIHNEHPVNRTFKPWHDPRRPLREQHLSGRHHAPTHRGNQTGTDH